MTYGEVFTQILSEISGRSVAEITALLLIIRPSFPEGHKFDDELSEEDSENLLASLRAGKDELRERLIKGKLAFIFQEPPIETE